MKQLGNKILILSFLLFAVSGQITLNTIQQDSILIYEITSTEQLVVIGFEGQEETRDYLFCRLSDCSCEDMVSKGPRSHPQYNDIQTTTNIYCQDSNTMKFERIDNGYKPYIWGNENKTTNRRITEETTTNSTMTMSDTMMTTTAATVTYDETDMTASKTVSSELVLKWKFNTDGTIDLGGSPQDTSQDLTLVSYTVTDSSVKARIKRALSTGDTSQDTILQQGSSYTWAYASSSALTMENHGSDCGTFTITLSTSGTQGTTSFGPIIALIMSLMMSLLL